MNEKLTEELESKSLEWSDRQETCDRQLLLARGECERLRSELNEGTVQVKDLNQALELTRKEVS